MDNLKLDRVKLTELRRLLPHGSMGEIAIELNIHRNNVADVFKGKWENQQVIDLAIEKIEAKREQIRSIEGRIDQVLGNS